MPKRFTATEKWKDLWFKKLKPKYKLLWIYLLDECDNAGLIELDLKIAEVFTGFHYSMDDIRNIFGTRLFQITEDVWFIPKFISFQYKILKNGDNVTKNVISKLKKYDLITDELSLREVYCSPNLGIQEKDKDKEEEMDTEKERSSVQNYKNIPPTLSQIIEVCKERGYLEAKTEAEKFYNYYESIGWKVGKNSMKDWGAALVNWFKNYKKYNYENSTSVKQSQGNRYSGFDSVKHREIARQLGTLGPEN